MLSDKINRRLREKRKIAALIERVYGQFSRGSVVENDIMTIREVADYLKITEKTAYRLATAGDLPGFKVGGSWRFRRSEIDRQSVKSTGARAG